MSSDDLQASIVNLADLCIKKSQELFGVQLDYSKDSIFKVDNLVNEELGAQAPEIIDNIVKIFGAFVGECIRNIHGGHWQQDDEHGVYLDKIGKAGIKVFPFAKVRKRLMNGEPDSISFYYKVICTEANKSPE